MKKLSLALLSLTLCLWFGFSQAQDFPVTIQHRFGETTISSQPERIIMLGYNDQDALYAVGAQPVAVRHWFHDHPHDIFPWAEAAAGAASPDILSVGELDFETILSYQPDLIIGQFIGLSQAEYERLAQIAPTVAQSADYSDYETPWQTMTRTVGKAVGRASEAEEAIDVVQSAFVRARFAHPEFVGKEIIVALPNPDGGYWVYGSNDNRGRTVEALGFNVPDIINQEAGDKNYVALSAERLDLLEADVLLILESDEHPVPDINEWLNDPLLQSLEVVKAGRLIRLVGEPANAMVFNTVLSLPYALEALLPELVQAFSMDAMAASPSPAFPVTITHKFGETTISEKPVRVLSLGYTDHDSIIALGVTPIAVRYWYGDEAEQIRPWARALIGDAEPEVLNFPELNFEAIAALQPDVIVALYSGINSEEYATLSQIAPTVAQPDAYVDYGLPWYEQTLIVGQILGESEAAAQRVAELQARFAAVEANYPEFTGKKAVIAMPKNEGEFYFSGVQHERMRFLTDIGFALPQELSDIAGDSFFGTISAERFNLFDNDLLLWLTSNTELYEVVSASPLYQQLQVVKDERDVFLDSNVAAALSHSSVLSLPVVFDELVPQLADTLGLASCTKRAFSSESVITEELCLPENPQRIVTLDPFYNLQMGLELGLPIVGSATSGADFPESIDGNALRGVVEIGQFDSPNLEIMTTLRPDLIIGDAYLHEANQAMFAEIAPTAIIDTADWQAYFRTIAAVAGVPERAEQAFADYEARVNTIKEHVGDRKLSFVRIVPDGFQSYVESSSAYAPFAVLQDAGVRRPAFETASDDTVLKRFDWEGLQELQGDILFYVVGGGHDSADNLEQDVTSNPLWQAIPAVAAGQAYKVDAAHWMSFGGLASANKVLDDVEQYLLVADSVEHSTDSSSDSSSDSSTSHEADLVDVIASRDDLSTFYSLLEEAGQLDLLRRGNYTILAPSNAAFEALPAGLLMGLRSSPISLQSVLSYHFLEENVSSSNIMSFEGVATAEGANFTAVYPDTLRISVANGGAIVNDTANVIVTDLIANNGVVHIIDGVLVPARP